MVITLNGEAKAVRQDVASYEETQETLAARHAELPGEAFAALIEHRWASSKIRETLASRRDSCA